MADAHNVNGSKKRESNPFSIGIFDSGSGGLSIFQSIRELLPYESYIYLGDHANLPYGDKSTEFIRDRVYASVQFLLSKDVKLIVIACNTATIAGIHWYREQFPHVPIVGVVPVIKTAASLTVNKHFVVLSTPNTAKSEYQQQLIAQFASDCTVASLGSYNLVPLIESGILDGDQVQRELTSLLEGYEPGVDDVIVLGCTHYPFIIPALRRIVGNAVHILDSGGAVARQVQRILAERNDTAGQTGGSEDFYTTADADVVGKLYYTLLGRLVPITHVNV